MSVAIATATEAPALSRHAIVNCLGRSLDEVLAGLRERIDSKKQQLVDPSETDREQQGIHRESVNREIVLDEHSCRGIRAFQGWLKSQSPSEKCPFSSGNFVLLEEERCQILWVVYDSNLLCPGEDHYVSFDGLGVEDDLGVKEVLALSSSCELIERLNEKQLAIGDEITIGPVGDESHIKILAVI